MLTTHNNLIQSNRLPKRNSLPRGLDREKSNNTSEQAPASNWYWDLLYCNKRIKVIQTAMYFVYDNDQTKLASQCQHEIYFHQCGSGTWMSPSFSLFVVVAAAVFICYTRINRRERVCLIITNERCFKFPSNVDISNYLCMHTIL